MLCHCWGRMEFHSQETIPHVTSPRRQQDRNRRAGSLLTSWEDHIQGEVKPAADKHKQPFAATVLRGSPEVDGVGEGTRLGSCSQGRACHDFSWPNISLLDLYLSSRFLSFHCLLPCIVLFLGLLFYTCVNLYQFWKEGMSSDMSSPWHLWLVSPSLHLWV